MKQRPQKRRNYRRGQCAEIPVRMQAIPVRMQPMDFNIRNFDDLIEHPSSGLEQPNPMGNAHLLPHHQNMENPLRKIKFNEPIDKLVSQHLSQSAVSPFAPYEIKKDLSRVFYTSFFIGLLYYTFATPQHGIMAIYNRRTERKFQIAVVYGKTGEPNVLHIHEIDFGTLSGRKPLPMQASKKQLASLKANIERDFGGSLHISAVVTYEYTLYEQYTNVDMRVGVRMNLERSQRIDDENLPKEYSLHDADYSSYDNALSFLELWHEEWAEVVESTQAVSGAANDGPSIVELIPLWSNIVDLIFPSLINNIHQDLQYGKEEQMMGYFHSIIFAALSDSYYERVMNSEYPPLHYNPEGSFIYLTPPAVMQHEHILINMQMGKLHTPAGYEVLAHMRSDRQEAKIYELFMEDDIELALDHDDGLARERILRWDIHSVAESLHQDLLLLKDISTDAEMSEMYKELLNEKWLYYSGLAVGERTMSFRVIHSKDETSDAAQIANQMPLSETEEHAFAIVSIKDGQFAIRALSSNQHYLNTDNVISQCEERRKKRNMASICHSYDEKWSSEAYE
uniref:Uncharacterized protein n=1 Tax=Romanomermis culicivorax TaxID=13658 RepID=A0A915J7V7_ROMCU